MKKMCMVVLTTVIIIVCVIAFFNVKDMSRKEPEGVLVETNLSEDYV